MTDTGADSFDDLGARLAAGIASISHADPRHERITLVDWMLGNACSYACSYCPPALHDGSVRWQDADDVVAFYAQLARHYVEGQGRAVWLQFTGGEPTMHPRIIDLLDAASGQGFHVSLISNASRTFRFWERIAPHLNAVILTYHSEFADHKAFVAVASLLALRIPVHVNVTMPPDRFEIIHDRAADIAQRIPSASMTLKPLRVGFGSDLYPYSADQIDTMKGRPGRSPAPIGLTPRGLLKAQLADGRSARLRVNDLTLRQLNRWRGWTCAAGLESLRIKGDGTVFRAVCGEGGRLGVIGQGVTLPDGPALCSRAACSCVSDILMSRSAPPDAVTTSPP